MASKITESRRDLLSRKIRKEFDEIDFSLDWVFRKADKLINTARSYGLDKLADEMTIDKNFEYDK